MHFKLAVFCTSSHSRVLLALQTPKISWCETLPCLFSLDSLWKQYRLKQVTELNQEQTQVPGKAKQRWKKYSIWESYWRRHLHIRVFGLALLYSVSRDYKNGAFLLKKSCFLLSHYHSEACISLAEATLFKLKCRNLTHNQSYGASSGFTTKKSLPKFVFCHSDCKTAVFFPLLYSTTF